MSRIGKKPVPVPTGVTVNVAGQNVSVKGPKGELKMVLVEHVLAKMENGQVKVDPRDETKLARSCWGMSRTMVLINGRPMSINWCAANLPYASCRANE